MQDWLFHLIGVGSLALAVACWVTLLIGLPGNWFIVAIATLLAASETGPTAAQGGAITWGGVALLALFALIGEALEFASGAAGAARQGASRLAVTLSLVGAMVGGIVGLVIGAPVPLIGSVIAGLVGSTLGAFVGAYYGQSLSEEAPEQSFAVGRGAMIGRLLGTVAKLAVGAVMLVWLALDLWLW